MENKAKRMAYSSVGIALSVVIMFLGAVLELGMYASPLIAGMILMFLGTKYGRKWHLSLYIATSILSVLLVPHIEANMMFVGFFGWYPIIRPSLQKLPKGISFAAKVIIFNLTVIVIEYIVVTVLVPEVLTKWMIAILLVIANVAFVMYDALIPRMERVMKVYAKKLN